jgi:CRP/FNR family transcriptional regulator, cyclic AMP receptor protein
MDPALLEKVPLFSGLNPAQLRSVAALAETRRFEASSFIFKEGDSGDVMYGVVQGKVRISKRVPGIGEEALAILEPGNYFGEMALIEDGPRSADAIAHIGCTLWVIERGKLEGLMFMDKELAYSLLWSFVRTLSERLRETNDKIKAFFAISKF